MATWIAGVRAATKTVGGTPDYLLAITADSYEVASDAITTALADSGILAPVRVLDAQAAFGWCGPVPWVWSKHYGTTASAKVVKPGDHEHLRAILHATSTGSPAAAWDGGTNRRVVGSNRQALANGVAAMLQAYPERVIIVLEQSIDREVLRMAQEFANTLAARGHKEFILVLHDPLPGEAEAKAGYLTDLMKWIASQFPAAQVQGLIGHTPAPSFEALQAWLEAQGFAAPLTV
jgi:hypothetical protein